MSVDIRWPDWTLIAVPYSFSRIFLQVLGCQVPFRKLCFGREVYRNILISCGADNPCPKASSA